MSERVYSEGVPATGLQSALRSDGGDEDDVRTLSFEVYKDSTNPDPHSPETFAVLTTPGPETPRGTLDAVQEAVDDSDLSDRLSNGGSVQNAGTVRFTPGKDDGEVLSVEVEA